MAARLPQVHEPTVVVLRDVRGARATVVCFHALSGSAAVYGDLAAGLEDGVAVLGVQSVGLTDAADDSARATPTTLAAMAAAYADALRAEPGILDGPLVLTGFSMGGMLALEVARHLGVDRPVPPVVAVDCDPLYTADPRGGPWRVLVEQTLAVDMPWADLLALPVDDALLEVRHRAAEQGRLPSRFPLGRLRRMLEVGAINEAAAGSHVPEPYAGNLHVVRGVETLGEVAPFDPWEAFAHHAVVHAVPGGHHDLLTGTTSRHVAAVVELALAHG